MAIFSSVKFITKTMARYPKTGTTKSYFGWCGHHFFQRQDVSIVIFKYALYNHNNVQCPSNVKSELMLYVFGSCEREYKAAGMSWRVADSALNEVF